MQQECMDEMPFRSILYSSSEPLYFSIELLYFESPLYFNNESLYFEPSA